MTRMISSHILLKSVTLGLLLIAGGLGIAAVARAAADNYVKAFYAACSDPSHGISGYGCGHYHLNYRNADAHASAHEKRTGHIATGVLDTRVLPRQCVP